MRPDIVESANRAEQGRSTDQAKKSRQSAKKSGFPRRVNIRRRGGQLPSLDSERFAFERAFMIPSLYKLHKETGCNRSVAMPVFDLQYPPG